MKGKKIIVVIPACNTARTLEAVVKEIPRQIVDEIIMVDDASTDGTSEIAKRLNLKVIRHEKRRGYGGAQKTLYREALKSGADIIVMVHADNQYDPKLIPQIVAPIAEERVDVCFGSRMAVKRNALKGGMPLWRFIPNWALTIVEESILRLGLSEYHTGYRAFGRQVLLAIPFEKNSDDYVFDTEIFVELRLGNFRATEIPIPTRYFKEASSPNFFASLKYGFMTLWQLVRYLFHISGIKNYPQFNVTRNE